MTEDAPQNPSVGTTSADEDDEPDDWDKRIASTGCAGEQTKMNDCYFDKKDWRQCKAETELACQIHSKEPDNLLEADKTLYDRWRPSDGVGHHRGIISGQRRPIGNPNDQKVASIALLFTNHHKRIRDINSLLRRSFVHR